MSKFFATGDSESESDDQYSDEDEGIVVDDRLITNRFVYSSSESEDEGKRVVRSEKDKRLEDLRTVIKAMKNHLKIADWVSIAKDFDALQSALEKAKNVLIDRTKAALVTPTAPYGNIVLPSFVLQSIHTTDESQKKAFTDKDAKKKMSGPNAKALNSMKQKIRKFVQLYGQQFEKFVQDPKTREEAEGEEKGREEKEEKEEKTKGKPVKKAAPAKKAKKEESDDEDEDDDDDSDVRSKFAKKKTAPAKKKAESEDEDEDEDEDDEDEDDDEDDDDRKPAKKATAKKPPAAKKAATKAKKGSDDDNDDDDEDDDDEDEDDEGGDDDDDGEEVNLNVLGGNQAMFTREFWVKKQKDESDDSDSSDDEAREDRVKRRHQAKAEKKRKEEQANVARALTDGQAAGDKSKAQEMNPEQVIKKLKELLAMRGKRGTDKLAMIADLKLLASKATEPAALLKVHTTLASALFDVTLNKNTHMPTALWKECEEEVRVILGLLEANTQVRLSEDEKVEEKFDDDEEDEEAVAAASGISMAGGVALSEEEKAVKEKSLEEEKAKREDVEDLHTTGEAGKVQYVMGNLFSFLQLLCMEYRKSMQSIDFHTEEYIARLKDELVLEQLVGKAQDYYHQVSKTTLEASVAFLRLELVYYKYTADLDVLKVRLNAIKQKAGAAAAQKAEEKDEEKRKVEEEKNEDAAPPAFFLPPPPTNLADQGLVGQLATFLYKHGSDQSRVRALLMHVYHLSLHNQYLTARDMLLMSHIHETVQHADIKTQVLFNRAICQLGLCAFRCGEFRSALEQLGDLVQSNKIRELLAQGTSQQRWQERDVEKEELEKKRQLPFHMHINQDFIEAVHLISAMLAEVPNLAQHGAGNKKKIISKAFRRLFDATSRQAFNGPPENTRDLIMAATRAMRGGEWEKCIDFLLRLRMWSWMSKEIAEYAQAKLRVKIQEETLKTYLLTYSQHFQSISTPSLCQLFALPSASVHRIASKLMVSQQLSGSWDQPSDAIVIHAAQPSKTAEGSAGLRGEDGCVPRAEREDDGEPTWLRAVPAGRVQGRGWGSRGGRQGPGGRRGQERGRGQGAGSGAGRVPGGWGPRGAAAEAEVEVVEGAGEAAAAEAEVEVTASKRPPVLPASPALLATLVLSPPCSSGVWKAECSECA